MCLDSSEGRYGVEVSARSSSGLMLRTPRKGTWSAPCCRRSSVWCREWRCFCGRGHLVEEDLGCPVGERHLESGRVEGCRIAYPLEREPFDQDADDCREVVDGIRLAHLQGVAVQQKLPDRSYRLYEGALTMPVEHLEGAAGAALVRRVRPSR